MELLRTERHNQRQIATTTTTPPKIRVLLIITCLGSGGATHVVLDIADYFNRHPDFEIEIVTGPIPADRADLRYMAAERHIRTHMVPSLVNQISPSANMQAIMDLRRIMVRGNYDIVHTHSSVAGVVGRIAARLARIPTTIHHVHGWGLRADMSKKARTLYVTLERLCARLTNRMVVVSSPDIEKGLSYGIGSREKYALIYNGIDLEKYRQPVDEKEMRKTLGLRHDTKLVGMVGRLDLQKNPIDFIRAAAIVCQCTESVQFLIIGDGVQRPQCEQLIQDLQLEDNVFLLGYRSDVASILPILTVTAMSSLWEGLPLAFLEAMSAEKPIVCNDVDGARDVVHDGETGFLVPPRQPAKMAARILQILDDNTLCTRMGQIARQRSQDFSIERMGKQIESLYIDLHAANRRKKRPGTRARVRRHTLTHTSVSNADFSRN